MLLPHLPREGVSLFSLQKDKRPGDEAALAAHGGIIDLAPLLHDFSDTAAAVSALDLVISVDSAVAHLAAALHRPTWVLLPSVPDWRWLKDRADSPWYPSARLFRASAPRDWPSALGRLGAALRAATGATDTAAA
jgi:ADP-heptose:LPS heptosyltransferase